MFGARALSSRDAEAAAAVPEAVVLRPDVAGADSADAAVALALRAGTAALAALAYDEAARLFQVGLAAMERVQAMPPAAGARQSGEGAYGQRICELLLGLGTAELATGNLRAALTRFWIARDILRRLSSADRASHASDGAALSGGEGSPLLTVDGVSAVRRDVEQALRGRGRRSAAVPGAWRERSRRHGPG